MSVILYVLGMVPTWQATTHVKNGKLRWDIILVWPVVAAVIGVWYACKTISPIVGPFVGPLAKGFGDLLISIFQPKQVPTMDERKAARQQMLRSRRAIQAAQRQKLSQTLAA